MEDVSRIRKAIKIQIVTYKVEYGTFPHLSKNKKRGFWAERPKDANTQHSYNQANTQQRQCNRKQT